MFWFFSDVYLVVAALQARHQLRLVVVAPLSALKRLFHVHFVVRSHFSFTKKEGCNTEVSGGGWCVICNTVLFPCETRRLSPRQRQCLLSLATRKR